MNRLLELEVKERKQVIDAGVARQRKSTLVVNQWQAGAGLGLLRWGRGRRAECSSLEVNQRLRYGKQ